MAINERSEEIARRLRRNLIGVTDEQVFELTQRWVEEEEELKQSITPWIVAGVVAALALGRGRMSDDEIASIHTAAETSLARLVDDSLGIITSPLPRLADGTTRAQIDQWNSQLPEGMASLPDWTLADLGDIDSLLDAVRDSAAERLIDVASGASDKIRHHLERGLAEGANPEVVARRIIRDVEASFEGGLARASRIARTEMLDANREVQRLNRVANPEVTGWIWIATLDGAVCISCMEMHGTEFPPEEFGPADHPNGRCYAQEKIRPWQDMGISMTEPPDVPVVDSAEWFESLTDESKRGLLGPTRYAQYKAGDISFGDFAERVSNDGWRDHYRVKPVRR